MWDHMHGVDNRKWEVRERKSIATQISWGVRFDADTQVHVFLDRIAVTEACRMDKAGVKGKCVSLKLWRAVADAPANMRKVTTFLVGIKYISFQSFLVRGLWVTASVIS